MKSQLLGSIGLATGLLVVWWFTSWRISQRRPISTTEFIDRLKRQRLGLR